MERGEGRQLLQLQLLLRTIVKAKVGPATAICPCSACPLQLLPPPPTPIVRGSLALAGLDSLPGMGHMGQEVETGMGEKRQRLGGSEGCGRCRRQGGKEGCRMKMCGGAEGKGGAPGPNFPPCRSFPCYNSTHARVHVRQPSDT